jgi:hypothetical protein
MSYDLTMRQIERRRLIMMEHSEIKTEKLEEVAGGSDMELKPVKPGRCRRCGREEELI